VPPNPNEPYFRVEITPTQVSSLVISQITEPALNTSSESFTVQYAQNLTGEQKYQQIEGAGTKYHLSQEVSGKTEELAMLGTHKANFAASRTFIP